MDLEPIGATARVAARHATAAWNVYDGAVRSGKTIGSLLEWVRFVRHGPPGPLLMVGRTERTLRRNVIDTLVELLGEKRCRLVAGSGELWLLGRRVYLVGANDRTAQEKIRGLTLAGAYVDEASTVPESFWTMLDTRMSIPGARVFATTNPDGPRHWLKVHYLDRAALVVRGGKVVSDRRDQVAVPDSDVIDLHRFRFGLDDNPTLDPAYRTRIESTFTGLWRRRLIDGEWSVASGVVYEMWDEARHVVHELPPIAEVIGVGVDYGSTNPTSALMLAISTDGRLVVTREWRHDPARAHRALTVAETSAALRRWIPPDRPRFVVVDPAAAPLKVQLHHDGLRPVTDADNAVLDGIRMVASLLATDRLVVHSSCAGLLEELPSYAWDDKAAEAGEDKPVKINDHSADSLRYVITTTQVLWRNRLRPPVVALSPAA